MTFIICSRRQFNLYAGWLLIVLGLTSGRIFGQTANESRTVSPSILSIYGQPPPSGPTTSCLANPSNENLCDFVIAWNSPTPTNELWVTYQGSFRLVTCQGSSGEIQIPWVALGESYEFALYATPGCTSERPTQTSIARIRVNGTLAPQHPWWDMWPRPTSELGDSASNLSFIKDTLNANMLVASSDVGITDEGRGPYFRQITTDQFKADRESAHDMSMRVTGYTEGQGQYVAIIGAVDQTAPGYYVQYPPPSDMGNAAELIGDFWDWNINGYGADPSANTVVWMGLQSFINDESWLGPFVLSNYGSISRPTYPDGTPATGYKDNNASDPRNAHFYDAIASKETDGAFELGTDSPQPDTNTDGMVDINGQYAGLFHFGKDTASPFWISYANNYIHFAIANGGDGFWMDNSSGWDFIGNVPITTAFGDWSVAQFNSYLANHPNISVPGGLTTFNIVSYLAAAKNKFGSWSDPRFLSDPVWLVFLAFKGDAAHNFTYQFTQSVQDAAQAAGKSKEIYLGGNDIPDLTFGAFDGNELPQVNCEFSPDGQVSIDSYGRGLPPYGHTGPFYATAASLESSQHAIVWYYADQTGRAPYMSSPNLQQHMNQPNLGEVLGFEALANNVLLNTGATWAQSPGTATSMGLVNHVIQRMAPVLGYRNRVGAVALVYGNYTQATTLTPGGFAGQNAAESEPGVISHLDSSLGFSGWAEALEDLHIPYRVIPDFKLNVGIPSDVSVLILPHIRAMDPLTVKKALIPFAQRGGVILVSGNDSGTFQTRAAGYNANSGPILFELTEQGRAIFVTGNPGFDYYVNNPGRLNRPTKMASAFAAIKSYLDPMLASGQLPKEVQFGAWATPRIRVTKFGSEFGDSYYYDFQNVNIDVDLDTLTPSTGGTVALSNPPGWSTADIRATWYNADNDQSVPLFVNASASGFVSVTLPSFRAYGTLLIKDR